MIKYKINILLVITSLSILSYSYGQKTASLKDSYKNDFLIGTALNATQIEEKDPSAKVLIPQQFNAATPENIMKAEIIHPGWDQYNFDLADKLVAYGKKYNIKINGHTLYGIASCPLLCTACRILIL